MTKTNSLLKRGLKKLWTSKSGGVLIYLAFGLPMLFGAMALSVDLGRAFILNTELKDFSDAAALAGAAELDGRPGAMVAAEAAARSGLSGTLLNVQAFATDGGGAGITIKSNADPANPGIVFLQTLPEDGTDFTAADTATDDSNARFIFVSVVNRNVRSGLSRALGIIPDFDTSARSIAGFNSVTCRVPPIFMCNPLEGDGTSDWTGDYVDFPTPLGCIKGPNAPLQEACLTGRQMLAKNAGNGSAYVPGNFGMLDPTVCGASKKVNQGAKCLGEQMATYAPDNCVIDTVDFNTGESMGPVRAAVNVRFDMYTAPHFNNDDDNPFYPPALNVTRGYTPPGCGADPESDPAVALALPRDTCFATDSCADGRYGSGDWHQLFDHDANAATPMVNDYWLVNHPGKTPPANYGTMNRYELYRYEIETPNMIPDNSGSSGEDGNPQCYSGTTPIPDPTADIDETGVDETDRRVIIMAAVNCRGVQLSMGEKLAGNESDVPTIGFIRVFLTEPALEPGPGVGGSQADMYVELAGVLEPAETDALRDIVQLYR